MTNKTTIHGFLIDPQEATITPVILPNDTSTATWDEVRSLLNCSTIEPVKLDGLHDLLTNEEGWTTPQQNAVLVRKPYRKPAFYGGKAVILGFDPEQGSSVNTTLEAKYFCQIISAAQAVMYADFAGLKTSDDADGNFVIAQPMSLVSAMIEAPLRLVMGGTKL